MKKICLYVHKIYKNNRIFENKISEINRNDELSCFRELKKQFSVLGYDLSTQDINPIEKSDAVLYNEMPAELPTAKEKSYLLALETELIKPNNWYPRYLKKMRTVFSSKDFTADYIDVVKVQFPQQTRAIRDEIAWSNKKLCTLVAGGKLSLHKLELYSARIRWINWFTKHHPNDFDFYGAGWKSLQMTGPLYIRVFNKIPHLYDLFKPKMKLYRGMVDDKYQVLNQYKFSICFENAVDIKGYITEKIFDCFFSGNVPVYLGAPDVTDYIPENCFIDARKFSTFEELYTFMNNMSETQHQKHLQNAKAYLASELFQKFSNQFFAKTIVTKITHDLTVR